MIRNMIFDMGQVLIRWTPDDVLSPYDLTRGQKELLQRELFHSVEWIQQDRGIITKEKVVDAVCARLPQSLHEVAAAVVFGWHRRYLEPMPGMAELVRELKGEGYRIFLLSNASLALRDYFDRIPGSECFEKLMVSAEEQLLKPQHEIYERLYEKFGLNPAECFFIDDSPANIEGAILTGMQGTVFTGDVQRLRRELNRAGIRCGCGEPAHL